ncbi:MAG: 30S ribosomal protein S13 [Candidatus Thermoplasmatota archaeon]|nr:30S ribosomal protein S13 [Candidatus Thermoplasmatota archaeon]
MAKKDNVSKEPQGELKEEAGKKEDAVKPKETSEKKEPKPKKEKKEKKEQKKPKEDEKENILYIVRIGNRDLDGEQPVKLALSNLKGIGMRLAEIVSRKLGIDPSKKIGALGEDNIEILKNYVEAKEYKDMPVWLLNHRNEIVTGKNLNLVSNDLEIQLQDDINYMKKIKSYKGIRHESGHKVRGQRTRSNGRKGLAVGVIKKKESAPQTKDKE